MPTYMILTRFTDKAAMNFAARANVQSAQALLDGLSDLASEEPLNGSLEHLFFTAGEYEMVLVIKMPGQKQAVAYSFAMTRMLGARNLLFPSFGVSDQQDIFDWAAKVDGP